MAHTPRVGVDVATTIEIARPREAVWRFAADPDNARAWYRNIERVEWETDPPLSVGSRIRFVAGFLGRKLAYTYEVREIEEGARFSMGTTEGPLPMETTYEWADAGPAATSMTLRNRGELTGLAKIATPLIARAIRRENRADLARLKALLER